MSVTGAMDFKQTRSKRDMVSHTHTHTHTHTHARTQARTHTICGSLGGLHAHTHVCAPAHTLNINTTHTTLHHRELCVCVCVWGGGVRERESSWEVGLSRQVVRHERDHPKANLDVVLVRMHPSWWSPRSDSRR